MAHLSDEAVHSEAYREDIPGVLTALNDLEGAFSDSLVDKALLKEALEKMEARFTAESQKHERNVRHSFPRDMFRTLNCDIVARVGPRSCLGTNHTRSFPQSLGCADLLTSEQWRYQQFATRILYSLLQRDMVPTPELARYFLEQCTSPHTATRAIAVR